MKVYLKNIKHYFLTVDTNGERKKHMVDEFREYDLTEVNPILDENRFKSGAVGFSRMIDLALRNQDRNKPFQPFVLYEDDCSKYREFPEYIEVPDDSDFVYIGISVGCMHENENESHTGCYFKIVNDSVVRIYNMLSMHGIMVCSASGALAIQKALFECYYKGIPCDIYVAYIQPYYNVYALKTPLVYQDGRYGGQECPTRFVIDLNHDNLIPKDYINTTGLSIITCSNSSNTLIIN
jgi:hypothetical protein